MKKEQREEIMRKAWQTFQCPIIDERLSKRFFEEASMWAEEEFWTGKWCDLPHKESEQIYWLHQYWLFVYDEIMEKVVKE